MVRFSSHLLYMSIVALLILSVPSANLGDIGAVTNTIIVIGFLGGWRYSWAILNFIRAFIYRYLVYPARKARARARYAARGVESHTFYMVTSYMVDISVTIIVYRSLFSAAAAAKGGATIVTSVVDGADERVIRSIFEKSHEDLTNVKLIFDRIPAKGKRDAVARALKRLASLVPTRWDIVVFLDGDTIVPIDITAQAAPFFTNSNIGALTTNEAALTDKKGLYRSWFSLRFRQRQMMMCSMGLASHVLTLTGRLSVFRADLAIDDTFIQAIAYDYMDHPRLGRVDFLTGDDKSTWYWLLTRGYQMLYLPDVKSKSFEAQPRKTFVDSAKTLMIRWYGNMLRTNGRALKISPNLIGGFTWWSIMEQRISMWTTLVGPISVVITALFYDTTVVPLYLAWVMVTRYIFVAVVSTFSGKWFPISLPFILYFSQVVGAIIKVYVLFRLDKQKWTRQKAGASGDSGESMHRKLMDLGSQLNHTLALCWLTVAIVFLNSSLN